MLLDLQPESPYRPVNWRFRLAGAILSGQLPPSRRRPDPWVSRAIQFQAEQADAFRAGSDRPDPAILGAFEIRFSAEPRLRSVLEARVLAGQSAPAIAELCVLTADVVEAFERLFFDVRDRLGASDYISAIVIGMDPHDGLPTTDVLLKAFAYGYGPLVLDSVIAVLDAGEPARGGATSRVTGDEKLIRMAIAARMIPVTERTAPGLIRLQSRLLEFERGATADVFINRPIRASVEPWASSTPGEGAGWPVRASSIDLGSASLAEPVREGRGDRAGAILVPLPERERIVPETPSRRTA